MRNTITQNLLRLSGEPPVLEEAIRLCESISKPDHVSREFDETFPIHSHVLLRYDKLIDEEKWGLSKQLILQLGGQMMVEWEERNPTKL